MQGVPPPPGGGGGGGGSGVDPTLSTNNSYIGGFYGAFQNAIIDDSFNFIDALLGHSHSDTPGAPPAPAGLGYAADKSRTPMIDKALAAGQPAPRFQDWAAWAASSYEDALYTGNRRNPGERMHASSGIFGIDRKFDDWAFGFVAGIGRNTLTQNNTDDGGRIDATRLGGYASYRPATGYSPPPRQPAGRRSRRAGSARLRHPSTPTPPAPPSRPRGSSNSGA